MMQAKVTIEICAKYRYVAIIFSFDRKCNISDRLLCLCYYKCYNYINFRILQLYKL